MLSLCTNSDSDWSANGGRVAGSPSPLPSLIKRSKRGFDLTELTLAQDLCGGIFMFFQQRVSALSSEIKRPERIQKHISYVFQQNAFPLGLSPVTVSPSYCGSSPPRVMVELESPSE